MDRVMICANPNCNKEFEPKRKDKIYCSGKCATYVWLTEPSNMHKKRHWDRLNKCRKYASTKEWKSKHRAEVNAYNKQYFKEHPDKARAAEMAKRRYNVDNITDTYLKKVVTNGKGYFKDTPINILEQRRLTIKLKRKIYETQRSINSQ